MKERATCDTDAVALRAAKYKWGQIPYVWPGEGGTRVLAHGDKTTVTCVAVPSWRLQRLRSKHPQKEVCKHTYYVAAVWKLCWLGPGPAQGN